MMRRRPNRGLTLIELLVAVAIGTILIMLAAPSFRDFILMQRLKSANAQLVTDLQFARAEAVARNRYVRFSLRTGASMSCYTIYTSDTHGTRCNCLLGVGSACSGTMREIKTVQLPVSGGVRLGIPAGQDSAFAFDHVTGGIVSIPVNMLWPDPTPFEVSTYIDAARTLRTTVGMAGRPTVCAPGSLSVGAPAC
jgi:type IV fimbrial biogenesis protein FimT